MTRVLIIDDKEENLYYLQALLTSHGCVVESAHHGAEALVKARQHPPDVVISDLLMPVMDGYTLLRHWKADARLKQIPFIVYTATYTEPEDERLALNLGADVFILKPAEPETFIKRLREVQAKAAAFLPPAAQLNGGDEKELLKTYSETLIRKLEEKTLQLEESNHALRQDIAERKKTEETLRLLHSAVLQTRESILITDAQLDFPGPRIVFVNPAFTQMTGYAANEVIGQTPRILQGPRTDRRVLRRLRHNLEQGALFSGETIQYRKDGSEYYQAWQIAPLRDADGNTTHYVAVQRDVTDHKRAERIQAWEAGVLAAISSDLTLPEVLGKIARCVEDAVPAGLGAIMLAEEDGRCLRHGAAPGLPEAYNRAADGMPIGTMLGSGGAAAREQSPVMVSDLATDTDWKDLREVAQANELRACWSTPVLDGTQKPLAAVAVYYREWQRPRMEDRDFISRMVHLTRIAIERHRREAELRASEQRFRHSFLDAATGMAITTTEGRFVEANKAYCQMLGYTEAELREMNILALTHPDDRPRNLELFQELVSGQRENYHIEKRYLVKNGGHIWARINSSALRNTQDRVTRIIGVAEDITERKLSEAKLKERDELLLAAQAIAQMGSWILDLRQNRLIWSETTCRLFGIAPGEFRETFEHFCGFILPEDRAQHASQVMRISPENPYLEGEYRIRRPDGEVRWMYERGTVEYDQNGEQVRRLGMVLDITERKQADEELRWKTAFLEAQVDSSLDGILVVDNTARKILQNQRMNELWKIPPAIAENPDDAQQIAFVARRTRNSKEFASKVGYLNTHPDEISRDEIELVDGTLLDRFSSPVRDKSGRHYGRIWTFRDITDQRKLEMQFRQSQKMEAFGQLAGGVAHDFNNILAVIQMQAGLMRMEPTLSLEQRDFAGEIEKAAERGANLTRQLLLFSRQQTLQPRDFKLNEAVENMAKMLRRTLGEQFDLQFKFAPEPLYLHADSGMIDQILLNLTVNARDAMPKGGQILIETSAADFDETRAARNPKSYPGAFACLRVADHGTGIPPEVLPRIFEPFFTTKGVGKGTGLGLATVFGIVQQHKGWIDVSSEVGQGSTFQVYLPRLEKKADTEIIHRSTDVFQGGGETILLVEDETSLRESLRAALTRLEYRVLEAASGDEALALWQKNHGSPLFSME